MSRVLQPQGGRSTCIALDSCCQRAEAYSTHTLSTGRNQQHRPAHRLSKMLVLLLASHGMDGLLLLPNWCLAVSSPRTRTGLGSSQQSWGPVVIELQC
jgi:hypothetical protein